MGAIELPSIALATAAGFRLFDATYESARLYAEYKKKTNEFIGVIKVQLRILETTLETTTGMKVHWTFSNMVQIRDLANRLLNPEQNDSVASSVAFLLTQIMRAVEYASALQTHQDAETQASCMKQTSWQLVKIQKSCRARKRERLLLAIRQFTSDFKELALNAGVILTEALKPPTNQVPSMDGNTEQPSQRKPTAGEAVSTPGVAVMPPAGG